MDHISSSVALPTLSHEQQDAFWEQGFLVVDNVFTGEEVEALRAAASIQLFAVLRMSAATASARFICSN